MSNNNETKIEVEENLNTQKSTEQDVETNQNQAGGLANKADVEGEDFDELDEILEEGEEDETDDEGDIEIEGVNGKKASKQDDEFSEEAIKAKKEKAKIEFGKYVELFKNTAAEAGASPKLCDAIQDFIEYLVSSSLVDIKDDIRFLKRKSAPSTRPSFGDRGPRRDFGSRPPRRDFGGDRGGRPSFGGRDRDDRGGRPSFRDRDDRGGDRGGFGSRPPRRDFDSRPPRKDFGGDRGGRPSFGNRDRD